MAQWGEGGGILIYGTVGPPHIGNSASWYADICCSGGTPIYGTLGISIYGTVDIHRYMGIAGAVLALKPTHMP